MIDLVRFGERVKQHRHSQFLTLRGAALFTKVSASTMSRVECGGMPDVETYFKLCKWAGICPLEYSEIPSSTPSDPHPEHTMD